MFDSIMQPYNKSRHSVVARKGMVCTSNPLAAQAGLDILKKGGNAVDAAIATAAVLTVVEPMNNGIGGDAFAIVWMKEKMYGLNASGYSPKNLTIEELKRRGYNTIPKRGWVPVMVPGQPKAWAALSKRFGKLDLLEVLQPAIQYASEGYAVSPVASYLWGKYVKKNQTIFQENSIYDEWYRVFTKDGKPYQFGDLVKLPDHVRSLQLIGETQADAFYHGEIADAIDAQSKRDHGFLTKEDLEEYDVEWVDPISIHYRGYDVWEIPPNGQGIVTLIALNILKNFDFSHKEDVETYHRQFEAIKIAFAEALSTVTDLRNMETDYHFYLTDRYGKERAAKILHQAVEPVCSKPPKGGTVYLCTADQEGNMVSYIQSNYMDFGSGIVIEGYGVALQNRGYDFSMNEKDANVLAPRKKSYHTIIPGFLTKNGKAIGPFGVMGGYMQPQGHLQILMNYIDFHLNPQMCIDAPRWQWKEGKRFIVEPDFPKEIVEELKKRGHEITISENCFSYGRAEMIIRLENDSYVGGCESRTDGTVSSY